MNARDHTVDIDTTPRNARPWLTTEVAIMREHYPVGGPSACLALLPGRNYRSVALKAQALGLRAPQPITQPGGPTKLRRKWAHLYTPEFDAKIRAMYQTPPRRGLTNAIAAELGVPRDVIFARARMLGLMVPRTKEPEWTAAEIAILEEVAHLHLRTAAKRLAAAGYPRTERAIDLRRRRMKFDTTDPDHMTARQLSVVMGVDAHTVCSWIRSQGLKAGRRGTDRVETQGGDQFWIAMKDVRAWMRDHPRLVDLRKVDRFWFLELALGAPRHD